MSIWKTNSIPAQREAQAYMAKQIIEKNSKLISMQNRTSHSITSQDGETGQKIGIFGKCRFGRG